MYWEFVAWVYGVSFAALIGYVLYIYKKLREEQE